MAVLVTDLVNDVQGIIPAAPDVEVLKNINRTWGDFLQRAQVYQATETISVTQSTSLCYLSNIIEVQSAVYYTDSSTFTQLIPDSTDGWDLENRAWRGLINTEVGTPRKFALEQVLSGGNIVTGLYMRPAPDTTTTAGYPILHVTGQKYAAFTTASTAVIPAWLTEPEFLVNGAAWRSARDRGMDRWPELYELYKVQRDEQLRAFSQMNNNLNDQIVIGWNMGDRSM